MQAISSTKAVATARRNDEGCPDLAVPVAGNGTLRTARRPRCTDRRREPRGTQRCLDPMRSGWSRCGALSSATRSAPSRASSSVKSRPRRGVVRSRENSVGETVAPRRVTEPSAHVHSSELSRYAARCSNASAFCSRSIALFVSMLQCPRAPPAGGLARTGGGRGQHSRPIPSPSARTRGPKGRQEVRADEKPKCGSPRPRRRCQLPREPVLLLFAHSEVEEGAPT